MAGPYGFVNDAANYISSVPNKVINLFKSDDAPGDYSSRKASLARQQKLADALTQMGAQEQAVSSAGGITAPVSGMGALARGLSSFGGAYLSGKAAGDEAALEQSQKQKRLDFLAGAPGSKTEIPAKTPDTATDAASAPTLAKQPVTPTATYNQKRDYFVSGMQSDDPAVAGAAEKGFKALEASRSGFSKINPKDYTVDSVANFSNTGEIQDLVAKPTGAMGDIFDSLAYLGFDTKNLAKDPVARRIISGYVAKTAGLITEDSAAKLAIDLTNAGVGRVKALVDLPGELLGDVPGLPSKTPPFDLFAGGSLKPATAKTPMYTLPQQQTEPQPIVPRPPTPGLPMGAPPRQATSSGVVSAPPVQAQTASQEGGAQRFDWQNKGFVPLAVNPEISPMERQKLQIAQPEHQKSVRTSVGELDSWAKAGIDLLNDPGFERISGLFGSNLKDISKEAISASAKYKQIENIAKGFSVQSMKEASKTGATSLGQITMGEYPMLRDMAGLFLNAGTAPAKRAALTDFVNKLIEVRNNKLGEYNSTYPALSYQPPAYAPFGGIKQPRTDVQNQETLDLIKQYGGGN